MFMCGVEDLLFSGSRFVWNLTVSTLRRWYTERLRACHQVLRTWCGLRDVYQVSPGGWRPRGPLRDAGRSAREHVHLYDFITSGFLCFQLLAGSLALGSAALANCGLTIFFSSWAWGHLGVTPSPAPVSQQTCVTK